MMKFGILIESNDPETAWNGVRFGVAALTKGHEVRIFLMSRGVECPSITHGKYHVKDMLDRFTSAGGQLLACGTCLHARNAADSGVCPISTMDDCIEMVEWADKTLTF
jgi:uncharacterized protein involved in oxidation of intracellular sulfur